MKPTWRPPIPHRHVTILIPAHNEEGSIAATVESVLNQTRPADTIVVIANGCTDRTVEVARRYPIHVLDLPALPGRKSEAMNIGWATHGHRADYVMTLDADTTLPPTALADWLAEMEADPTIGGSGAKFTVQHPSLIGRLQKAEYADSIQVSLDRGWTFVLAGAGSLFRGSVLRQIAARPDRTGPWTYGSAVEDFEVTYRIREAGHRAVVSPTVRAYTDGMTTVRALLAQRVKWQAGTSADLLRFGWNPLTRRMWLAQAVALVALTVRLLWVAFMATAISLGMFYVGWTLLVFPVVAIALALKQSFRIPHRDRIDVILAAQFWPGEFMQWLRMTWLALSWVEVIRARVSRKDRDLWAAQYAAEGVK